MQEAAIKAAVPGGRRLARAAMCNAKAFMGTIKKHLSSRLLVVEDPVQEQEVQPRRLSTTQVAATEEASQEQVDVTKGACLKTSTSLLKVTGKTATKC